MFELHWYEIFAIAIMYEGAKVIVKVAWELSKEEKLKKFIKDYIVSNDHKEP
jgi:hypothetical protein